MGGFTSYGIRSLTDAWMRFFQPSLPCALRLQVYDPQSTDFAQLGFVPSVTGAQSGVLDVLIQPPPDVQEISLHNIGLNSARLRFGARRFIVSHTFVAQQMVAQGYTDPYQVFGNQQVMGLYYDSRLFSIESVTHEDVGGQPVYWNLVCNAPEFTSPPAPAT